MYSDRNFEIRPEYRQHRPRPRPGPRQVEEVDLPVFGGGHAHRNGFLPPLAMLGIFAVVVILIALGATGKLSGPQQQPLAEKENIWSTFSTATRVQIPPETPSQNNPSASKETSLSLQSQNLLQSGESFRKLSGTPENTQGESSAPPLP